MNKKKPKVDIPNKGEVRSYKWVKYEDLKTIFYSGINSKIRKKN